MVTNPKYIQCDRCKNDILDIIVTLNSEDFEDLTLHEKCEIFFYRELELQNIWSPEIYPITYLTSKQV